MLGIAIHVQDHRQNHYILLLEQIHFQMQCNPKKYFTAELYIVWVEVMIHILLQPLAEKPFLLKFQEDLYNRIDKMNEKFTIHDSVKIKRIKKEKQPVEEKINIVS